MSDRFNPRRHLRKTPRMRREEVLVPGDRPGDAPKLVRVDMKRPATLHRRIKEVEHKVLDRIRSLTESMGIDFDEELESKE